MAEHRYDLIGRSYTRTRREDPRIAAQIADALGPARTIVNLGAGTGNYEPSDRTVTAVEPSPTMVDQRVARSPRVVRAAGEHLPFRDRSFDAALAVLTIHHWTDVAAGLREMRRVADRQVVMYFEPLHTHDFWALDYFPEARDLPSERNPPGEQHLRETLDVRAIRTVLVPHDCTDGFGAAYWQRPEAYLDPTVQAGMSWLAFLTEDERKRGTNRLAADLDSGEWDRRFGHLRNLHTYDGGYRIAICSVD
ncbi:MAG TPA: class I SAM-dependent methyltransferase [Ilumatobacteraceae bacterium]|nr:class I SAM-dependent methyltransferase [Ilumatobacteraceae bacterium]